MFFEVFKDFFFIMFCYDDDGGYGVICVEDFYDECSLYRFLYEDGDCYRIVFFQLEWYYSEDFFFDRGKGKVRVDIQLVGGFFFGF